MSPMRRKVDREVPQETINQDRRPSGLDVCNVEIWHKDFASAGSCSGMAGRILSRDTTPRPPPTSRISDKAVEHSLEAGGVLNQSDFRKFRPWSSPFRAEEPDRL